MLLTTRRKILSLIKKKAKFIDNKNVLLLDLRGLNFGWKLRKVAEISVEDNFYKDMLLRINLVCLKIGRLVIVYYCRAG